MTWQPPTLRSAREATDDPKARTPIRCGGVPGHRCGRRVDPQMVYDVSGLPQDVMGGRPYACDACLDWLLRTGRVTRETLLRAWNAPADRIARGAELDRARTREL